MHRYIAWLVLIAVLAGCTGDAHPVVKVGVVAPFEGRGRLLGYEVLRAVKLAAADANARHDFGRYRVLVVAYNDDLDMATAARQAKALAADADVVGVVGPCTVETVAGALPVLAAAGVPAMPLERTGSAEGDFEGGAAEAERAAGALLRALAATISEDGEPSRAGVARSLGAP